MKKFIQTTTIILVLSSTTVFCQNEQKLPANFLLNYGYKSGQEFKYNRTIFCNNDHYINKENAEKIVSIIKMNVLDSLQTGGFTVEFALDSTYQFVLNKEPKIKSGKDLELAKVDISYSKVGKEINKKYLDGNECSYARNTYYTDNELLLELPTSPINFGKSWKTNFIEKGSYIKISRNFDNKLIGIETKNGHNCYRIDFNGIVNNESFLGDLSNFEKGKTIGSYWIDTKKLILVALEYEVTFNDISSFHAGVSVMNMRLDSKLLMIMPPHKTTITLIE